MKISKILLVTLAVMFVLGFSPLASAGDGSISDPYTVLYIGWTWGDPEANDPALGGTSMGNGSETIIQVPSHGLNASSKYIYYEHIYVDIEYDDFFVPVNNGSDIIVATDLVENSTYDYLFVDMFYLPLAYVNPDVQPAYNNFFNATSNVSAHTASMYSNPADTPPNFEFKNELGFFPTQFAIDFNNAFNNSGAIDGPGQPFSVYKTLLSLL